MVVDTVGRAALRAILQLLPGRDRRAYAGEILAVNRARREEVCGTAAALEFWARELGAALAAVWTAWTDPGPPARRRRPAASNRSRASGGRRRMAAGTLQDLRWAVREVRRGGAISAMIAGVLTVGIGAVLTVFSMVDGLLLHPVPVPEPERVVRVFQALGHSPFGGASYPMLSEFRRSRTMEGPAGWTTLEAGVRLGEVGDRVAVGLVTGDFFEILRVTPALGRVLQAADDEPGAPLVVVLGHELWERLFHRDPGVVGSTVEISGTGFTVVGVTPEGFRGASLEEEPELWVPLTRIREVADSGLYAAPNVLETRAFSWISMVGRLRDGVGSDVAEVEIDGIVRESRAGAGDDEAADGATRIARVRPLSETAVAGGRDEMLRFVAFLGGTVTLTLVVACLNSALLIATRARSRDLELSVRQALGATRGRVLRQLLAESLLLALTGAAAGIGVALLAARVLRDFSIPGGPSLSRLDLTLDPRMVAAALALALISAAAFGLWPALAQSRRHPGDRLRAAGRGVIGDVAGLPLMISLQAGLSLVLLVGALLFGRTIVAALGTPLGFDPGGVVAVSFAFRGHGYADDDVPRAATSILEAVESSSAIGSAALASHVPLSPPWGRLRPIPEGAPDDREATFITINTVTGGYFRTLRIPLVAGRTFDPRDRRDAPGVAMLNRAAASTLFPGERALGRRLVLVSGLDPLEVVGIVEDHKVHSVVDDGAPYLYLPASQNAGVGIATDAHLVARASGSADDALAVIRDRLREFDATLPVYDARLVESQVDRVLMPQRFGAWLLGLLGAVTLAVSAVGVYAMVSFGVRRRTREIGIRMALGAGPRRVMLESVARTAWAVLAGVTIGVVLAAGLVRFVEGYLYGVDVLDPGSFGAAAMMLVAVSLVAAAGPAFRAARIGPDRALREDP